MLNVLNADESEAALRKTNQRPEETRRLKEWLDDRIKAGKKKPIAEVVTLVPILAALLLDRNVSNRPISKVNTNDLREDIAGSRFVFNGESIVVSDTGGLLDGQHRCLTVVQTGVPIETVIVFGPKEAARFTIDTGKSKSASNFLAMKGRHYTHALAAAASYILQWKLHGRIIGYGSTGHLRPTKQQILNAADEYRGIDDSIEITAPSMNTIGSHAVMAFCHYAIWKRVTREAADAFILKLINGDDLRKGDPLLWCRNKMIAAGRDVSAGDRAEMIFKTWNAHRIGQSITTFRISGGSLPKLER